MTDHQGRYASTLLGNTINHRILKVLAHKSMTIVDIADEAAFSRDEVRNALNRMKLANLVALDDLAGEWKTARGLTELAAWTADLASPMPGTCGNRESRANDVLLAELDRSDWSDVPAGLRLSEAGV